MQNKATLSISTVKVQNKKDCLDKAGKIMCLSNTKTVDLTAEELANYLNNGYSFFTSVFSNNVMTEVVLKDKNGKPLRDKNNNIKKRKSGYYTANQNNFEEQYVLALDIENDFNIEFTIEDAKEVLRKNDLDNYCLIYNTFSNQQPGKGYRFRIVFFLDRAITNHLDVKKYYYKLINLFKIENKDKLKDKKGKEPDFIYLTDTSCSTANHVYYPASEIVEVKDSVLNLDKIDISDISDEFIKKYSYKTIKAVKREKPTKKNSKKVENNLNIDKELLLDRLNTLIKDNFKPGEVIDVHDSYKEVKSRILISELLEVCVYENFLCILHNDTDPSAFIYEDQDGTEHYCCWACNIHLDIIQLLELLLQDSFITDMHVFNHIQAVSGCLIGSKYQTQTKAILLEQSNNVKLLNKATEKDYKRLNSYLNKRRLLQFYVELLAYATAKLPLMSMSKDNEEDVIIFVSTQHLADLLKYTYKNINRATISKKINILCSINLLEKVELSELKKEYREKSLEIKKAKNTVNHINYIRIKLLSSLNVSLLEVYGKIDTHTALGIRKDSLNRVGLAIAMGQEEADRIYVQNKKKVVVDTLFYKNMKREADKLMDKQGYFTEAQLVSEIDKKGNYAKTKGWTKEFKKKNVAIYLSQYITTNPALIRTKCNKEYRAKHSIPTSISSQSYIITY